MSEKYFSIGEIAERTGITVDTVRIWERRYGKPQPVRLPSGHRRYTEDHLVWLRRVAEAMSLGHRAGAVVRASDQELDVLLTQVEVQPIEPAAVDELYELAREVQPDRLRERLEELWADLGPEDFLADLLAPFLARVGRGWADGDLEVRHERMVSEEVSDLLRIWRASQLTKPDAPALLLATLAGERHGLGLRVVALSSALAGVRTHVFGTELPLEEIAAAAVELKVAAVVVSVSLATGGVETDRRLGELRSQLDPQMRLAVGGRGARGVRRALKDVDYIDELVELRSWLAELTR